MRTGAWPGCLRSPSGELKVHRGGEKALKGLILTDEGLPLASSARVTSELRVGLETKLAVERGLDLTLVAAGSGEERTPKLGFNKELGVKELGGRVEGCSRDGGVDVVGRSNGVATNKLSTRRCYFRDQCAHEARRATTSAGVKPPASLNRCKMLSTESKGSGTVRSGAGWVASGRPTNTARRGAPGQLLTPIAPAS